ncbi:hypothetical protein NEMIN01_0620 [Nematocida minor]|uniref:uncharacterized protein n=1 Tax=Nematocida minor TaxID=1912983 RepID=UPI00221F00B8|nr:uncharacterized protein NEMIN01_0620 [Nematocida minor]KAI5189667.1 hypothetical protein NEMIN01_0620 [Nematocida minor]
MKIQLESVEEFENIFKEILSTEENAKNTQDELDVLMHIKNLFLKNVEIGGEELNIGQVTQEKVERKKEHAKIVAMVEEAERNKMDSLKTLCKLRRELPLALKEEIESEYQTLKKQLQQASSVLPFSPPSPAPDEDISRIKHTVEELSERWPVVISQIKEQMACVEKEVKERIDQKGRDIETEALSLLFKDELELPDN